MSTAEEVAMLEHQIATVLDDMRTEWIEGLLPKLAEFVEGREQAAYRRALEEAADAIQAAIENPSDDTVDAYHFDGLDEAATICRDLAAGVGTKDEPLFACCGEWHSGPPCPCRCGHAYEQHTDSIGCVECKGGSCVKYVGTKDGDDDAESQEMAEDRKAHEWDLER